MSVQIHSRSKTLRTQRSVVRVEHLEQRRTTSSVHKLKPITIPPKKRVPLTRQTTQNVFIPRELGSPPKRSPRLQAIPKMTGPPRQQFSEAQSRMLLNTTAASGELLKRKPTADELAAVAVTGAQQQRQREKGALSPRASESKLEWKCTKFYLRRFLVIARVSISEVVFFVKELTAIQPQLETLLWAVHWRTSGETQRGSDMTTAGYIWDTHPRTLGHTRKCAQYREALVHRMSCYL